MSEITTHYKPQWVSPPGDTISNLIEERGWTQAEFSRRSGFSTKFINQLINGKATISEDTALSLERVLGSTARFWLTREAQYRAALAKQDEVVQLKKDIGWLRELPVVQMIRFGWIKKASTKFEQVHVCLRFFGVASVAVWRSQYEKPIAAFRASEKSQKRIGAVAAWLREGERRAMQIECGVFTKEGFQTALQELRSLTLDPTPEFFVPQLIETCSQHGVAIVFLPTPRGCPVNGATRWISQNRAMLLLSLRYKSNDMLWFTYFHEAAHLLKHQKKMLFLEGDETGFLNKQLESEADKFAGDILIPPSEIPRLRQLGQDERRIRAFAQDIGIAPGIVLGRMQHHELIPWNTYLNKKLKVRYKWSDEIAG